MCPINPTSPHKILVIDDDLFVHKIVALCLEPFLSVDVQAAPDGRTGLEYAAANVPDLITLDFDLPDVDGLEVLHLLRSRPELSRVPVVAMTGAIDLDPRCAQMAAACEAFLPKPVDFRALRRTIRQWIERPEGASAALPDP